MFRLSALLLCFIIFVGCSNPKIQTNEVVKNQPTSMPKSADATQMPQYTQKPIQKAVKQTEKPNNIETEKPKNSVETTENSNPIEQIVTVKAVDNNGIIQLNADVPYKEGNTVLDYLLEAGKKEKVPISFTGGKNMAYVEGINNLFEFDRGAESGWIYTVNDQKYSVGCSKTVPNAGSVIVWKYILKVADGLK